VILVLWLACAAPPAVAPHDDAAPEVPPSPDTPEALGRRMVERGGCRNCHHIDLTGGRIEGGQPNWPPAPNLTPAGELAAWSSDDFVKAIHTGVEPDGHPLRDPMPWKTLSSTMSDDELRAIFAYLKSLRARPTEEGEPVEPG
jgi:cytochrome c5